MKKYDLTFDDESLELSIRNDVINRNRKLIELMKLVNVLDKNFIISIDGDWGCGKTFFIKQLIYLSSCDDISYFSDIDQEVIKSFSEKHFTIYYNAWENDDHDNPLESIIYYIINEFSEKKKDFHDDKKLFNLAKTTIMNFIELSSFGILKKEDLIEMTSFEDLAKSMVTVEEKKDALNKLFDFLLQYANRLILIIDELDRCRPDYAVKVLETIKHFYNNPNITILVVTNNKELSHTISHNYGYNFDGYGYLNKIYDTVITLTNDYKKEYVQHMCDFSNKTYLPENISVLLFEYFNFSYREINKFVSMYRIIEPYTKYSDDFDGRKYLPQSCVFLPLVMALKIKSIELYDAFISGNGINLLERIFDDKRINNDNIIDYSWLCETFKKKNDENLISAVIREYDLIFVKNNIYDTFPFMESISMLGNIINVDN